MVAAEPLVPVTKVRIKFGSQGAHKSLQQPSVILGCGYDKYLDQDNRSTNEEVFNTGYLRKRELEESTEGQPQKRQKIDRNMSRQCSVLLRSLMDHRYGWVFNQPVDPVKLNIPDYHSVISKPMDLGTIKSKLTKNVYIWAEEFADDVRLTFSNAMLYNPPSNEVHQMAKSLSDVFEGRWKSFGKKWNPEVSKAGMARNLPRETREVSKTGRYRPETPALSECSVVERSELVEEKVKKVSLDVKPIVVTPKVKLIKRDQTHSVTALAAKSSCEGTNNGGRHDCRSNGANQAPNLGPWSYISSSKSTYASSSDVTCERPCRDNGSDASSTMDFQAKSISVTQSSKSDPDCDGPVSSMDDENACPSSQSMVLATDAASSEGLKSPAFDVQISPTKALRAAMLKRRFADTILKAKQRTLLDHSNNKADLVKMQKEKERLEKEHLAEKARIEAEIRAAEAATRMKEEFELKKQREREREAARLALQKMEEAVEIVENLEVEKELEKLCGSDTVRQAFKGGARLLENLGLVMKDDCLADEIEDLILTVGGGEEGEIIS